MTRYLLLILLASCEAPSAEVQEPVPSVSPIELELAEVPCEDGSATSCWIAFNEFRETNPGLRIVSILPIEYPVPQFDLGTSLLRDQVLYGDREIGLRFLHGSGTQRLLVLHTRAPGPWPRTEESWPGSGSCGEPQKCAARASERLASDAPPHPIVWLGATSYNTRFAVTQPGTIDLIPIEPTSTSPVALDRAPWIAPVRVEVAEVVCASARHPHLRGGPSPCRDALRAFMRQHPDNRIVSLSAIEHPAPDPTSRDRLEMLLDQGDELALLSALHGSGTQRFVVFHTRSPGPWPRSRDARLEMVGCASPNHCRIAVREILDSGQDPLVWGAVTSYEEQNPGTRAIVYIAPTASP